MNLEIKNLVKIGLSQAKDLEATLLRIDKINNEDSEVPPNPIEFETPGKIPAVLTKPTLWIWREGSKAADFGAKQAVVCATHGMAGAATVRIICMNGDPVVDVGSMIKRAQRAKSEGCAAVCIDLESYFIRKGKSHAERVYSEVTKTLPLLWAPKAYNDHMMRHWGFRDFQQGAKWLSDFGDGQVAWIYSKAHAADWVRLRNLTRESGNKDLYIPLGDFAKRGDHRAFTGDVPGDFKRAGMSTGSFMPDSGKWTTMVTESPAWKSCMDVYK